MTTPTTAREPAATAPTPCWWCEPMCSPDPDCPYCSGMGLVMPRPPKAAEPVAAVDRPFRVSVSRAVAVTA